MQRYEKKSPAKGAQSTQAKQDTSKPLEDNRHSTIAQRVANKTGMPDQLKAGIESLSGEV